MTRRFAIHHLLIVLSAICCSDRSWSQVSDTPENGKVQLRRTVPLYEDHIEAYTITWPWESLGPNTCPIEPTGSNSPIPSSAVNRGNGIGRINWLSAHPTRPDWLYACSPTGGLWISRNGGKSWTAGGTDKLPVSGAAAVALHPKRPQQWIVATGDGDDVFSHSIGLYLTTNGGREYQCINGSDPATALPISRGDETVQIGEVLCDQNQTDRVFVAASHGLWLCDHIQSKQYQLPGRRRRMRDPQLPLRWRRADEGIYYDLEQVGDYICAAGDSLAISADHGQTWQRTFPPIRKDEQYPFVRMSMRSSAGLPHFLFVVYTESTAFTGGKTGRSALYLFDLRSRSWQLVAMLDGYMDGVAYSRARAWNVHPRNPQELVMGNVHPVFVSHDGGTTFLKGDNNQMHDDVHCIQYASDGKTIWAAHDGGISVSYDGGVHWKIRSNGLEVANVLGVACGGPNDEIIAYGGYDTGGNVWRNEEWHHTSWGDGFEAVVMPNGLAITTSQHGQLHAIDANGMVIPMHPSLAGAEWHSWIAMQRGEPNLLLACGKQLVRSFDEGKTWQAIFQPQTLDARADVVYRAFVSDQQPDVIYAYVLQQNDPVHPVIWRTLNARESDPMKVRWEKLPALPVEAWIASIVMDDVLPEKCWVLLNHRRPTEKLWQWDGKTFTDVTHNLGTATCESMLMVNHHLYVGSNVGVFSKDANDADWDLLKGLPGVAIKSMCYQRSTGKLLVGTFGRGIWTAPLYPIIVKIQD